MIAFQLTVFPLLAFLAIQSAAAVVLGRSPIFNSFRCAIWILGSLLVCFPNLLTLIAHQMGIGRGTDLLLYTIVVVGVSSVFHLKSRQWGVERSLTLLARQYALEHADEQ